MDGDSDNDDDFGDEGPTAEELALIRQLSPQDAEAADALVLGHCSGQWQKVAMVVGAALDEFDARFPGLPYICMQVRMLELQGQGRLEIRGDVMAMRQSEVRLPAPGAGGF